MLYYLKLINWIAAWLNNRVQRVCIRGVASNWLVVWTKLIFNSFSAETVDVAEIRSVSTIGIGSVFNTLVIIPSELWYIWFTLAHFTFGTPVGTLSVLVVVFGTLGSFLAH